MSSSKAAVVLSQIIAALQMIFGMFSILLGVSFLVTGLMSGFSSIDIVMMIIFFGLAILLLAFSTRRKKLVKLFKLYVSILSKDGNGSIANLALATKSSTNVVMANLQKMIDKKYFANAYIDLNTLCIVFPNHAQAASAAEANVRDTAKPSPGFHTLTCRGCGGVNRIAMGQVGECEYCGSPIQE